MTPTSSAKLKAQSTHDHKPQTTGSCQAADTNTIDTKETQKRKEHSRQTQTRQLKNKTTQNKHISMRIRIGKSAGNGHHVSKTHTNACKNTCKNTCGDHYRQIWAQATQFINTRYDAANNTRVDRTVRPYTRHIKTWTADKATNCDEHRPHKQHTNNNWLSTWTAQQKSRTKKHTGRKQN